MKVYLSALLIAAGIVVPELAHAQRNESLESRRRRYESPQHFAVELRFSPYRPEIDKDPTLHAVPPNAQARDTKLPYDGALGGDVRHLLIGLEVDWQVLRIPYVGTLGPGISVGYVSMSREAPFRDARKPPYSAEQTGIDIFPLYALAVLRADVFWREMKIPIIPYVKAGAGAALWRMWTDSGTSVSKDGVVGKGTSFGTHLAGGVALTLNAFDEYTARNADTALGINTTSVFFEYYSSDLSLFGSGARPLWVGDTTWAAGLTFEF